MPPLLLKVSWHHFMKTRTAQCRLWIAGDTKAARDPGRGVAAATKTDRKKFRT